MGYLTPILVRNDCLSFIEDNEKIVIKKIKQSSTDNEPKTLSIGGAVNAMESLGTRHADVPRIILVYQNDWIDLEYPDKHDEAYIEKCIEIAIDKIETLKKKFNK